MSTITQEAIPEIVIPDPPGTGTFLSREQILDATDACFAKAGYDGTTIRAIAARLDCSVGSIYRYFRDKRDLLLACGRRMMRPVIEEPTFDRSLAAYRTIATEHGEMYRLGFWLAGHGVPEYIAQIIKRWGELLQDEDEAQRRWAMAHGLLMLGRADETVCDPPPPCPPALIVEPDEELEDMTLL